MKYLFIIVLISFTSICFSQNNDQFIEKDGVLYIQDNTPFTGTFIGKDKGMDVQISYVKGIKEGKATWSAKKGVNTIEGAYKNGKKYGLWQEFYSNGIVKEEGSYIDGEGTVINYDKKGVKLSEGEVSNDIKNGIWFIFEKGKKVKQITYNKGEIIEEKAVTEEN